MTSGGEGEVETQVMFFFLQQFIDVEYSKVRPGAGGGPVTGGGPGAGGAGAQALRVPSRRWRRC